MSSGSSAPAPPDYSGVARASENASKEYAAVMREQLAWAKEQYGDNKAFTDQVKTVLADSLEFNNDTAQKDRARYEELYQPLENKLVEDAESYATDERKELERGRSMGGVAQQFDTAGEAAKRQLESFGVDPTATRYAALDLGVRTQKAAAMAAAADQSDRAVDATGRALRSEAINVGKGYPGSIAQQFGTSQAGGAAGVNAQNQTFGTGSSAMTAPSAWGGLQNQAISNWNKSITDQYGAQMQQFQANNSGSSGIGSAIGGIAGMVGSMAPLMMSDERVKENIEPVGKTYDGQTTYVYNYKGDDTPQMGLLAQEVEKKHPRAVAETPAGIKMVDYRRATTGPGERSRYAEGGAVIDEAIQQGRQGPPMGIPMAGGSVPPSMSPSGGLATDDVMAMTHGRDGAPQGPAAINVDEFIFPADAARWYGEKYLQNMIDKARAAKQDPGTAKPERGAPPAQGGQRPSALPV